MANNHKVYRKVTGIVSIILGAFLAFATVIIFLSGTNSALLAVGLSTLFLLPAGILHLVAKNDKKLLVTAGILLLVGAGINIIIVQALSLYGIYSIIIGVIDVIYGKEK